MRTDELLTEMCRRYVSNPLHLLGGDWATYLHSERPIALRYPFHPLTVMTYDWAMGSISLLNMTYVKGSIPTCVSPRWWPEQKIMNTSEKSVILRTSLSEGFLYHSIGIYLLMS